MDLPVIFKRNSGLSKLFDREVDLFDRLFDDFDRFFGTNCFTSENGDVIYQLEVPGFNKDNLEVELSDGILIIKGDRNVKDKNYAGNAKLHKRLMIGSQFEDAEASIKDGILTVTLKQPDTQPGKKIEIE